VLCLASACLLFPGVLKYRFQAGSELGTLRGAGLGVQRSVLEAIAASIPTQWCVGGRGDLNSLVGELDRRRWLVRGEITLKYLRDGHFQD